MNLTEFKQKHGAPDEYGQSDIERYLYQIDVDAVHSDCDGETEFLKDLYSFLLEMLPEHDPCRKRD